MKLVLTKAAASAKILAVFIRDSSKTNGAGLTGLVFNSAGLVGYYWREGDATATAISLVTMTLGTYTSGGFKEMDATNMPGWYSFCPPNACFATGANNVALHLKGATNMVDLPIEIQLSTVDMQNGVNAGLTALPNAAAGATGGSDCAVTLGGTASAGSATTITLTGGVATDNYYNNQTVQINSGTGAGQARVIVAYVGSTKVATVGRAWATNPDNTSVYAVKGLETTPTWQLLAGTLAAAGASTATLTGGIATDSYYNGALLVITAGTGLRQARTILSYVGGTTVATLDRAWTTTPDNTSVFVVYGESNPKLDTSLQVTAASVQGNVTGSVGSVTGAVGSVTGNVGGNVLGSVNNVVQSPMLATGTATAGAANTITLQTALGSNNRSTGASINIVGGTGTGQTRGVISYVDSTKVVTVDRPWNVNPDNTSVYVIWGGQVQPILTVNTGTAQAGTATTIQLAVGASATDGFYNECSVQIVGGTGVGQFRPISGYVGATTTATVAYAWSTAPDNTSIYVVSLNSIPATDGSGNVAFGVTLAELAQAQPPATPSAAQALMLLYMALRNTRIIDSGAGFDEIENTAGTVIAKAAISDVAGVFTRTKMVSGP